MRRLGPYSLKLTEMCLACECTSEVATEETAVHFTLQMSYFFSSSFLDFDGVHTIYILQLDKFIKSINKIPYSCVEDVQWLYNMLGGDTPVILDVD